LNAYAGPLGIVLGKQGGVSGPGAERAITLTLDMPDMEARRAHWRAAFGMSEDVPVDVLGERFRMTCGNIRRAARLAVSYAALDTRANITLSDVRQANRALNRQALDTLAVPVPVSGD